MIELSKIQEVMNCFHCSFINNNAELIINAKTNTYFLLSKIETELDLKCKILEWLSRPAYKTEYCSSEKHNRAMQDWHLKGLNEYLKTDFSREQMEKIYTYLGNGVNRELCIKFIESGYDMSLLRR